jgi:hypothetical protein
VAPAATLAAEPAAAPAAPAAAAAAAAASAATAVAAPAASSGPQPTGAAAAVTPSTSREADAPSAAAVAAAAGVASPDDAPTAPAAGSSLLDILATRDRRPSVADVVMAIERRQSLSSASGAPSATDSDAHGSAAEPGGGSLPSSADTVTPDDAADAPSADDGGAQ